MSHEGLVSSAESSTEDLRTYEEALKRKRQHKPASKSDDEVELRSRSSTIGSEMKDSAQAREGEGRGLSGRRGRRGSDVSSVSETSRSLLLQRGVTYPGKAVYMAAKKENARSCIISVKGANTQGDQ